MTARRAAAALALTAAALTGCNATTLIEGDSITWQYDRAGGTGALPAGAEVHAGPGWQIGECVDHASPGCVSPTENLTARAGDADRAVILLGTNDADEVWNGGWTGADEARWDAALNAVPGTLRVVLVLPWLSPAARAGHRAEVDEARAWMTATAAARPNVDVIDWRPYAERPGVLAPDGVHLAHTGDPWNLTPAAFTARRDVITAAMRLP